MGNDYQPFQANLISFFFFFRYRGKNVKRKKDRLGKVGSEERRKKADKGKGKLKAVI